MPSGSVRSAAGWRCAPRADAARFTVSVTDSGTGIAREDLERILRPFERGRNIMVTEDGSLGLGLPLAKHLVELHGGALRIDSTLGSGTCVTLQMPRVPVHGAEA
ncbi:MAG: multi-sensor signal transduction histidine kinase [Rhodospirillaceae bacterium]|nr:MAG: multi-sensor signal transduction histidine kinase [Rhodospirillaceae bacterium]